MTIKASHYNGTFLAGDSDELRDTLFRTLRDLRTGRITVQQAKAVTTAATKTSLAAPNASSRKCVHPTHDVVHGTLRLR